MTVRDFNGTTGRIAHAAGVAEPMAYGTTAWLVKIPIGAPQRAHVILAWVPEDESDAGDSGLGYDGGTDLALYLWNGATFQSANLGNNILGEWLLIIWSKASGSAAVQYSVFNFDTTAWTHGNFPGAQANLDPVGTDGTIWMGYPSGSAAFPAARIAARAIWVNEVRWATTGDIEAAGLQTLLSNWVAATPDILHVFDQTSTTIPVNDLIDSSDQVILDGTAVINDDDPPGFTFDLGPTGQLDLVAPAATFEADASAASTAALSAVAPAAAFTATATSLAAAALNLNAPAAIATFTTSSSASAALAAVAPAAALTITADAASTATLNATAPAAQATFAAAATSVAALVTVAPAAQVTMAATAATSATATLDLAAPAAQVQIAASTYNLPSNMAEMNAADRYLGPLMTNLLMCLCEKVNDAPNPPAHCTFRIGSDVPHDIGLDTDYCCEGLAYVVMADVYPSSEQFPNADIVRQASTGCEPAAWGVDLRAAIVRCVPTGDGFGVIPNVDWEAAALQAVYDTRTLQRVGCCFRDYVLADSRFGMSAVIGTITQGTPQGGCIERSLTFQVQIPNCCD